LAWVSQLRRPRRLRHITTAMVTDTGRTMAMATPTTVMATPVGMRLTAIVAGAGAAFMATAVSQRTATGAVALTTGVTLIQGTMRGIDIIDRALPTQRSDFTDRLTPTQRTSRGLGFIASRASRASSSGSRAVIHEDLHAKLSLMKQLRDVRNSHAGAPNNVSTG